MYGKESPRDFANVEIKPGRCRIRVGGNERIGIKWSPTEYVVHSILPTFITVYPVGFPNNKQQLRPRDILMVTK